MSEGTAPARARASFTSARRTRAWSRSVTSSAPALRAAAIAFSDSESDRGPELLELPFGGLRRCEGGVALGLHRVEGPLAGVAQAPGVVRCGRIRGRDRRQAGPAGSERPARWPPAASGEALRLPRRALRPRGWSVRS